MAVYLLEADLHGRLLVQDCDRVSVRDSHDLAFEGPDGSGKAQGERENESKEKAAPMGERSPVVAAHRPPYCDRFLSSPSSRICMTCFIFSGNA